MVNQSLTLSQKRLRYRVGDDWEDVVQEAKMKCIKHEGKEYYDRYLTVAIKNEAIDVLKRRSIIEMVSLDEREEHGPKTLNSEEHSYSTDYGAILDLNTFMRKRWNRVERDAIYLYFTKQVSIREAGRIAHKAKTRGFGLAWLKEVKETFRKELKGYELHIEVRS